MRMCVCVYVSWCVHTLFVYACVCVSALWCVRTCECVRMCVCFMVCACVYFMVYAHLCVRVSMRVCVCECVCELEAEWSLGERTMKWHVCAGVRVSLRVNGALQISGACVKKGSKQACSTKCK
jgi:hypothetical protein